MSCLLAAMERIIGVVLIGRATYDHTRLARSNAELVERIVNISTDYGRRPATPQEAHQILGLRIQ
ncbi:MAG: 3-keto-5-aminohexanoate cleavage protein [Rhodobacteraceae bacterium]|nr:3-keto-5-aminohexanoate cleavage protein [Paracoccaceae bacterium]MCY4197158.1 3-keto-5-aminohexanoate cleavage protein [Paracoccaceae bacterium]